jgi:ubiquinone/menaquinone biosynthesis C-methylase UbiE
MANERIRMAGKENESYAVQGDASKLDLPNQTFDTVLSNGCLHYTGDTQRLYITARKEH